MSDSQVAISGLYDHEHEGVSARERRIPDWGGDDVFATTPRRRRFDRGSHPHERAPHLRLRDTHEQPLPIVDRELEDLEPEPLPHEEPALEAAAPEELAPEPVHDPYMEPPPIAANGRRMVTITGHPGDHRVSRSLDVPRRPARTIDERIAHKPERVAMWAFALGLLLIVIAVAT